MREFGVKVLVVSALLVAVLSDALPCGRDNSPINEVVTTPDTTSSSSPTTKVATTPDTTSSSSPTTEVATTPDTTSSSPTTEVATTPTIPSHCMTPTPVSNATGLYVTPELYYFTAMNCCNAYGWEPFIMRKGSKIDRQMLANAVVEFNGIWHPMNDKQNKGTFVFPNGTTVDDDNDALFVRNRPSNGEDCVDIRNGFNSRLNLRLYFDLCDYDFEGLCIDKEDFKEAHNDTYDDMYTDPDDYQTVFLDASQESRPDYLAMFEES